VLATALDPRTKMMYGVPADEHVTVWNLLRTTLTDLIEEDHKQRMLPLPRTTPPDDLPTAGEPATGKECMQIIIFFFFT
jgi:hypothetical protein